MVTTAEFDRKIEQIVEKLFLLVTSMKYPHGKTVLALEDILKDAVSLLPEGHCNGHDIYHYFNDKYMPKVEGFERPREI